jgi:peptidoglycan/LPS O-acetylase OafA/YrhL
VLGSGGIILALAEIDRATPLRIPSLLALLGEASFSIYLVHFSVITISVIMLRKLGIAPGLAPWLLCATLGVVAGLIFDRFLDQPIQRWARRRRAMILSHVTSVLATHS